jgi:cell division protein FtsW
VAAGGVGAYFVLPHVRSRVDRFLDPSSGDTFQITKAMEAFGNGGLFGRGPGEGRVKNALPDAHADFVFAVAGEEFGFVVCLLILSLFAFVVVRGLVRLVARATCSWCWPRPASWRSSACRPSSTWPPPCT